ncbi:hypothetical protein DL95DRAFT_454951 [Leptodontidium sp. 2 PMI_412]|nr:hypothetical protein DL95DRAFT_454951 [Leptodontidium sp. 2 PMI_412]
MSTYLEKAKARVVSASRPQAPLSKKTINPNGLQKRKSAVGVAEPSAARKRSKPDSLRQDSIGVSLLSSVQSEAIEVSAANKSSQVVVKQLQAQLLKLVKDQADDRARFQSKLDAQDSRLLQLQTTLDGRRSVAAYPQPPSTLSIDSSMDDHGNDENDEVKSEGSALDIYNGLPEPSQNVSSVSRYSTIALQQRSVFEEDGNLPPAERRIVAFYDGMQMPYVIRELAPCEYFRLPTNPNERFSHEFLKKVFGGSPISNGRCKIPTKNRARRAFPEIDVYRVFGAGTGYRYYGTYREPCAEMCCVPDHVKQFWAKQLGTQSGNGKSRSALDTLIHEWPRVSVGWKDEATGELIEYDVALEVELGDPLTRAITADEAAEITKEEVLGAFNRADYDPKASLALFYEYLQCVGYDPEFYGNLVGEYSRFPRKK